MFTYEPPVPADQLRNLPTRDAALLLLQNLAQGSDDLQYDGLIGGARMAFQAERDLEVLTNRLSDAWCWLEAHALLSRVPRQSANCRRLSRDGKGLAADPKGLARFEARTRLVGPLHPDLE
ncbi:hypothetical protein ACMZ5E_15440 [Streptomyces rhizosphaericola]|uniref:hypothetical protein n=1 Tax=Streptomyces rhizosphaericola TaxID=2564098 RepID=UPI0039F0D221